MNISDEPIEIDSDSKLDLGENLQTTHSPHTQSDKQLDHDQLGVETPLALSDGPVDEPCNSINTTDSNSSSGHANRVRFASPCNIPGLGLGTLPHSCDGDGKRSMTDPESSDFDESRDGPISPKRQKSSAPQGVGTALNYRGGRPPSVISDDDELDDLENLSHDNNARNASISTPAVSSSALGASRICPKFVDINQEWEYREIISDEVVDGVPCYEMEWCSSLIPKAWVENKELVAVYEARKERARARCGANGKRRVRPDLKQSRRVVVDGGASAGQQGKRQRYSTKLKGRLENANKPKKRERSR
jgi:hypothetical protein